MSLGCQPRSEEQGVHVHNADPLSEDAIEDLVRRARREFADARSQHASIVSVQSAPVLFFGDLAAYRASELRVVTVGLNPSSREFPAGNPWMRFPTIQTNYLDALCTYFGRAPLDWFDCYREVLQGLGASYDDAAPHRALHTDICSVVPTYPTWSKLSPTVQEALATRGVPLWHDLVAELRPHVIVASIRYSWFDRIAFHARANWKLLHTVDRARPYCVEARELQLPGGGNTILVRGRAANTPFGTVSYADRREIGAAIAKESSRPTPVT
ncbi:MAG TPA: hypothetical protein DFS52_18670 [Myxococcales bacterium]|nr:hypothetical protein [Myxococcales bacterium]